MSSSDNLSYHARLGEMLANSASLMIWIADTTKARVYFNQAWLSFRGRLHDQEYGEGWTAGVHPDDRERCLVIATNSFDARRPFDMNYRLLDKDGSYRWVRDEGRPSTNDQGVFEGYIGSCIDINDMIESRRAYQERTNLFDMLVNAIDEVFWISDLATSQLVYVSPAFERLWGIKAQALMQSPNAYQRSIHHLDLANYLQVLDKHKQDGQAYQCTYRIVDDVGNLRWIEERGYRVNDGDHAGKIMAVVCTDITEKMRAHEHAIRSVALFETLIKVLPAGIALYDGKGECQFVNPHWHEMTGISLAEASVMGWLKAVHPDDLGKVKAAWKALVNSREQLNMEFRLVHQDGDIRKVYAIAVAIQTDTADTLAFELVCVFMDVTQQKEHLQRIQHADKLDAIGALAGGIAHDFNNQLAGIMGYADALKRVTSDEKALRFAEKIANASQRASDLTKKLLTFSRKGQLKQEEVNVHRLIKEVQDILYHTIDKRIAITLDLQAKYCTLLGDPSELSSALLNMGLNARDAMPDGGELRISTRQDNKRPDAYRVAKQASSFEQYLVITISDTGFGMSQEVLDRIFEPFFTTKSEGKGTGMGLASVYGTVKHHGGAITVDSIEGKGTTFNIYLPVIAMDFAVEVPEPPAHEAMPQTSNLRILMADDEELVRELTHEILVSAGHDVLVASDGEEAIRLYQEHWQTVDLVVLDMIMPKADGLAAFKAMKAINPGVRAILASGYGDESKMRMLLEQGILAIVTKPFKVDTLLSAVEQAVATPV